MNTQDRSGGVNNVQVVRIQVHPNVPTTLMLVATRDVEAGQELFQHYGAHGCTPLTGPCSLHLLPIL